MGRVGWGGSHAIVQWEENAISFLPLRLGKGCLKSLHGLLQNNRHSSVVGSECNLSTLMFACLPIPEVQQYAQLRHVSAPPGIFLKQKENKSSTCKCQPNILHIHGYC